LVTGARNPAQILSVQSFSPGLLRTASNKAWRTRYELLTGTAVLKKQGFTR